MQKRLYELAKEAGYAEPNLAPRMQKIVDLVIAECIVAIESTPKHCAFTTHDLGIVECTIAKTIETVKLHFKED
jgi:hypothetical protein